MNPTPSNSGRKTKNLGSTELPLIDTVRVRGPVSAYSMDKNISASDGKAGTWDVLTRAESVLTFDSGERTTLRVSRPRVSPVYSDGLDERYWATLEFSVPRVLRGHNVLAATITEVDHVLQTAYSLAADHVDWDCGVDDLNLNRLDLTVDFLGVDRASPLLRALDRTRPSRVRCDHNYGTGNQFETLTRATPRRWRTSLYDKYAEVYVSARARRMDPAPEVVDLARGRLRYESQAYRPVLRERGLKVVSDLDQQVASDMAAKFFRTSEFGATVGVGSDDLEGLYARFADRWKEVGIIRWMLRCKQAGLPSGYSVESDRKYMKLADEWGLTADTVAALDQDVPLRLDFDTRRLVAA